MTNIFVGNLSYQTTQEELVSAFSQFGAVERAALVTDRMTGQPRGFGFVEMTNRNEAEEAIARLNGAELHGRTMNVNEARPRPEGGGFSGGAGNRPNRSAGGGGKSNYGGGGGGGSDRRGSRW